jgi:hypothetical protein
MSGRCLHLAKGGLCSQICHEKYDEHWLAWFCLLFYFSPPYLFILSLIRRSMKRSDLEKMTFSGEDRVDLPGEGPFNRVKGASEVWLPHPSV